MKEFKGTQGPWRADKRDWEESQIPWAITVPYNGACLPIADVCYNPTNKEVIDANAHLISAAPDLLDACQQLMACYDDKGHLLNFDVDIVRQALNKAL